MSKYRKEVNNLRKKSFPELKRKIWIIKVPFPIPGAAAILLRPNLSLLVFSIKCKVLSKKALRGLIAHELCHFSMFQKGKWKGFWKFLFKYKKERAKIEKATDKLAIKKGYGKELIARKKEAKQLLKSTRWAHHLDNYLTEEEVRKYMKKLG